MPGAEASTESRRSPKWEARRQAIVDTSAHLFARQGYHATGITELCAANDLGKGALYHYIGSKEELLVAIHDRVMDEVMDGAERVVQSGASPAMQLATPSPSAPISSAAAGGSTSGWSRAFSAPASSPVSSATSTRG